MRDEAIETSMREKTHRIAWVFCLGTIGTTFHVDLHIPLGVACAIPYTLAILLASWLKPVWAKPCIALGCSILTIIGTYYSPKPLVVPIWKGFTNRGLALFAMWIIAILLFHRNALIDQREEALARIRLLEDLLPICAECKKIRDGAQTWHP